MPVCRKWSPGTDEIDPVFIPSVNGIRSSRTPEIVGVYSFNLFNMCTIKISFRVSAEYCRQQFIETGECQPDTQTVEVDTATMYDRERAILCRFAPSVFSGDRVKLDDVVNGRTFADLINALQDRANREDAKRAEHFQEAETRINDFIHSAGMSADRNHNIWVPGLQYCSVEAAVKLPELAHLATEVAAEVERRKAAEDKKTADRLFEQAKKDADKAAKEEKQRKDAEKWIAKKGSAYLKRLFFDGFDYKEQALTEYAATEAPEYSDCQEWPEYDNNLHDCNTPSPAAFAALDKVKAKYPSSCILQISGMEVIQVALETPFGELMLERRVSEI